LLQLANIVARYTGSKISVCRDLALEKKYGTPGSSKHDSAFSELGVSYG
jgi:hypothetical protein